MRTLLLLCRWQRSLRWRTQLGLVLTPGGRAAVAAGLAKRGLSACAGPPPPGSLLVAAAVTGSDAHLAVMAGSKEGSDDLDQWVRTLDRSRML